MFTNGTTKKLSWKVLEAFLKPSIKKHWDHQEEHFICLNLMSKIRSSSWLSRPFFLLLLPLFFVLHNFIENFKVMAVREAGILLLAYTAASIILAFIFKLLLRNWNKASLLAFAIMCVQFFFGSSHDFL